MLLDHNLKSILLEEHSKHAPGAVRISNMVLRHIWLTFFFLFRLWMVQDYKVLMVPGHKSRPASPKSREFPPQGLENFVDFQQLWFPFFCGRDHLLRGQFWAMGRFSLLGGKSSLLELTGWTFVHSAFQSFTSKTTLFLIIFIIISLLAILAVRR